MLQMNKALLPLVEEDSNFCNAAPSLFGPGFAWKSKDHIDQVKAMRSLAGGSRDSKPQFFQSGPLQSRRGYNRKPGRGGVQNSQRGNRPQFRSSQGQRTQ